MKKNFWTARLKTILIVAVVLAVIVAVILGITSGASFGENVVGTILSPIRTGIAAIDRQAERYYNYIFGYEALKAETRSCRRKSSRWRRTCAPLSSISAKTSSSRRCWG